MERAVARTQLVMSDLVSAQQRRSQQQGQAMQCMNAVRHTSSLLFNKGRLMQTCMLKRKGRVQSGAVGKADDCGVAI